jgi:hypothetical protein
MPRAAASSLCPSEAAGPEPPDLRDRGGLAEAQDYVDGWLEQPCAVVVVLAIEHGAGLCSCDSDFARFEGLRWRDPLR